MLQTTYRAAAGAFTAICVVMQYWLLVRGETFAAMAASSVKFFSFFTILTNLLAAVALLLPLIAPRSAAGRFWPGPCSHGHHRLHHHRRGDVLPAAQRPQPAAGLADVLRVHAALRDAAAVRHRLAGVRRQARSRLARRAQRLVLSARLPCLDAAPRRRLGWYPYPFLDVAELGYPRALLNIVGLVLVFLALEVALVGIGRMLARRGDPVD